MGGAMAAFCGLDLAVSDVGLFLCLITVMNVAVLFLKDILAGQTFSNVTICMNSQYTEIEVKSIL